MYAARLAEWYKENKALVAARTKLWKTDPDEARRQSVIRRAERAKATAEKKAAREASPENQARMKRNAQSWYARNREKAIARACLWQNNPEEAKRQQLEREASKPAKKVQRKREFKTDKEKADRRTERRKERIIEDPEKYEKECKDQYTKRKESGYYENTKEERNAKARQRNSKIRAYLRERRKTDPQFRIRTGISSYIRGILRKAGTRKCNKTVELIGCSGPEYLAHILSTFTPDMTLDDYTEHRVEVDHYIPLAWFNLTNVEEQKKAFHYTNTRAMWASDNRSKGDTLPDGMFWRVLAKPLVTGSLEVAEATT